MVCVHFNFVYQRMINESEQEGTNFGSTFLQDNGWKLSRTIDFLCLLSLIEFTTRLTKLIGKIEPGSLVLKGGYWNSPV